MVDVRPRQLGDVDQAVDAVQVDERAEVDDVRDLALDDEPGLQAIEDLLADLLALLLEHRAARQHDVVARAVELDHLRLDLRAHVLVEVRHAPDVDERGGQEAAHAEVDDQPALDDLDHGALDRLAGLGRRFDAPPRLLEAGALLGHDQAAVLVLLGQDDRVDLLAEVDLVVGIDGLADRQLVRRDDALGLVADVDEDLVLVDPDDVTGDDLALLDRPEGRVVVGDDLPVDFEQEPVRPVDHAGLGILYHCLHRPKRSAAVSLRPHACSSDEAGSAADPLAARLRRARLRRQLRRAGGGARARRLGSEGARDRPLRARRAPDVGVRDAHRLDAGAGADGLAGARASTSWSSTRPFAPRAGRCRGRSRRSTTASCARCCGRRRRPPSSSSRPPPSPVARARPCTPTAASCARRWSSTRSAGAACCPTRRRSSRRTRASRAASRSIPQGRGEEMELWIDAGYVRAGYGWSFPARDELRVGVGSFWPVASRQGADRQARLRPRAAGGGLPGQLDPPPAARRGRGQRLLRRRLRRALPAADRRGHPHGAVLRARLRPRAARRCSKANARASRRCRATARSPTRTSANTAGC